MKNILIFQWDPRCKQKKADNTNVNHINVFRLDFKDSDF